jgi:WD40 repeat protein
MEETVAPEQQTPHQSGVWLRDITSHVAERLAGPRSAPVPNGQQTDEQTATPLKAYDPGTAGQTDFPPDAASAVPAQEATAAALSNAGQATVHTSKVVDTRPPAPLDSDTVRPADGNMDTLRVRPAEELLGDYELLEEIGRGSMGIVYRARQVSLERIVAVKVIPAGRLASAQEVQRFYAEAEAAASLYHPNIVAIYEIGCDRGLHFYAMRYVEGGCLAEHLNSYQGRWREIADLMAKVARAVEHAHRHGVLHRDLKPANILLDAERQPVVSDFGLCQRQTRSKTEANADGQSAQPDETGCLVGTPLYLAPELVQGREPASVASDVYSLGAILYELLTGQPPFPGDNVAEVLTAIVTTQPKPPSFWRRDVPRDLEAICCKCLEKNPAKRYASAGALAQDLERFLSGEPVLARRISRAERFWRWCVRNPVAALLTLAAAVTGTLAVVGVLVISVLTAWREKEAAERLQSLYQQTLTAKEEADRQRQRTARLLRDSEMQRRQNQQELADLALERAAVALRNGNVSAGLLWLVRALSLVPAEDEPRSQRIRTMLAGWSGAAHRLVFYAHLPDNWRSLHLHPSQEECFGVSDTGRAYRWPYRQEKHPIPICRTPLNLRELCCVDGGRGLLAWHEHGWQLWNDNGDQILVEWSSQIPLRCWAVSTCGLTWVAQTQSNELCLWKVISGSMPKLVRQWQMPEAADLLQCSDDGRIVVARTRHGTWILDSETPATPERVVLPHRPPALAMAGEGKRVVWVSYDRVIRASDVLAPEKVQTVAFAAGPIRSLAVSADDRVVVAVNNHDWRVQIVDTQTRRQIGQPTYGNGTVVSVALTPDARRLAVLRNTGELRIWELVQPDEKPLHELPEPVGQAELSEDGSWLVAANEQAVRLYRRDSAQWEARWQLPVASPIQRLGISSDGRLVMVAHRQGEVVIMPTRSSAEVIAQVNHGKPLKNAVLDPTGRWLATAGDDHQVAIWDIRLQQLLGPRWQLHVPITALAWSPDGMSLTVGLATGEIAYGKISVPLEPPQRWPAHLAPVRAIAFIQPERWLLTGGADGKLLLWDCERRKSLASPNINLQAITKMAVSRDSRLIFAAGSDFSGLLLRRAASENPTSTVPANGSYRFLHEPPCSEVVAASFSPQGEFLAVAYADGSLEVWDTQTGYRLLPTRVVPSRIVALAWPSNSELVAVCADGKVVARQIPTPFSADLDTIQAQIRFLTGQQLDAGTVRSLTLEQWQELAWQVSTSGLKSPVR